MTIEPNLSANYFLEHQKFGHFIKHSFKVHVQENYILLRRNMALFTLINTKTDAVL